MPSNWLAIAPVPAAFVPIRLPWIVLPSLKLDQMPHSVLPEMRLPSLAPVPPTVLLFAPLLNDTPDRPLAIAAAPAALTPR